MPRMIDKLDAALGRTPGFLKLDVDYLSRRPGPDAMIGPDGTYNAGWYEGFTGAFNVGATNAFDLSFQTWFHLTIDTPERFIVCNLADLAKVGNTAILVSNKETEGFDHVSLTRVSPQVLLNVDETFRRFEDPTTHSVAVVSPDDQEVRFSIHAGALHLAGVARAAIAPPFVQITRFHRGRGSLQWYGNLELEHGVLALGDTIIPLPRGALCTYDRTMGHQRGIQSWNWVAAVGMAVDEATGRQARLAVQIARDRPAARPVVLSQKYVVWVEGEVHKVASAAFEYDYTDEAAKETSPWRIYSPEPGESWVDLRFTPRFHRRDKKELVIATSDFNQYYGALTGRLKVGGRVWRLDEVFAVTEESFLEL